jgi:hypothetical protein
MPGEGVGRQTGWEKVKVKEEKMLMASMQSEKGREQETL